MVKVSVIIPSLNVIDYIDECIESVINQDIEDVEIICVDAGSTDGTREKISRYALSNSRIRILDSPIKSYGYQVNYGISKAVGKYVTVVESDDYIDLSMLSFLYTKAEEYEADVMKADYKSFWVDDNDEKIFVNNHRLMGDEKKLYYACMSNESLPGVVYLYDAKLWSALYKLDFLKNNRIRFNESPGAAYQDIGFVQQIHILAKRIVYTDKMLYYYRTDRVESSTNQPGWLRNLYQEYVFLLNGDISRTKEWQLYNQYIANRIAYIFVTELKRSIINTKFIIANTSWFDYYKKMQPIIKGLIASDKIVKYHFDNGVWNQLLLSLYSIESYRDYLRADYEYNEQKKNDFIRRCQSEPCIIFGSGFRGKKIYNLLRDNNINVVSFWDNDENKLGEKYMGTVVCKPQKIRTDDNSCMFVIAVRGAEEKIAKQLITLGVNENRIFYFDL